MKRPRLLIATTVPETLVFFRGFLSAARAAGFEPYVLSADGPFLHEFAAKEGVSARSMPLGRSIAPFADVMNVVRMVRLFRRLSLSIVHAHTPKASLLCMLAGWIARTPVRIHHVHGFPASTATGVRRSILLLTERLACACATEVWFVSRSVLGEFSTRSLADASKCVLFGEGSIMGVDAKHRFNPERYANERKELRSQLGIADDAVAIGFIGRFSRDKGIETLVDAWAAMRARESLRLVLVGQRDERQPLPSETIRALNDGDRVHILVPRDNIEGVYAALDLFVLPSRREGFPVVLLEAAAMQLPRIASAVTGCVDAIRDGVDGALVPVGDARALAAAITAYATDANLRVAHGKAARARTLADFRPSSLMDAYLARYTRLLNRH